MKSPVITVVGSFAVGMTLRTLRMPVFGETLLGSQFDLGPGGKGSNQAVSCARLGAESHFIGLIGEDKLADIATQLYRDEGVGTEYLVKTPDASTGVGFILLNAKGENGIVLDMGANRLMDRAFVAKAESLIARSDAVLSVLEVPLDAVAESMALGRKHGVRTILNPAPAAPLPAEMLRNVDLLTPNETELRILMGLRADSMVDTLELARELHGRFGITTIVTRGENGMLLVDEGRVMQFDAIPMNVVDTAGAGDAFTAALGVAMAEGKNIVSAIRFAGCNGSLACTKYGVVPSLARRAEVDRLLKEQGEQGMAFENAGADTESSHWKPGN
jgi:ribokinase